MSHTSGAHPETVVALEEFQPEWVVPPGVLIQREIDAAGLSQAAVAARSNISAKHLNQLIRGHVALSAEVAVALERVLGSPADLWLRMDATCQARQSREAARSRLADWAEWLSNFPTAVLIQRGVWRKEQTPAERVEALLGFFGVVSPDAFDKGWLNPQASYRRSQKFPIDAYSTAVWLRLVEAAAEAAARDMPSFSAPLLRQAAEQVPGLTTLEPSVGVAEARRLLREAGVVLVIEPGIDDTRINGVTRWSSQGRPTIALTGRQKSQDVFWFTLLHQIGHILMHPKRSTFLETGNGGRAGDDEDSQESAADAFAAEALVPPAVLPRLKELRSVIELRALAKEVGVDVGILAGRYAHETGNWRSFGKHRKHLDVGALVAL